jgi:hypothetical protein
MGSWRWLLLILTVVAALSWAATDSRSVSGMVTDKRGNLLPGAVVEIDNSVSKEIQSFIVQQDGRYHFNDLSPDVDFSLHALYRGRVSKAWTLSKFNGAKSAKADFVIPIE